jgi:hypothetical protein
LRLCGSTTNTPADLARALRTVALLRPRSAAGMRPAASPRPCIARSSRLWRGQQSAAERRIAASSVGRLRLQAGLPASLLSSVLAALARSAHSGSVFDLGLASRCDAGGCGLHCCCSRAGALRHRRWRRLAQAAALHGDGRADDCPLPAGRGYRDRVRRDHRPDRSSVPTERLAGSPRIRRTRASRAGARGEREAAVEFLIDWFTWCGSTAGKPSMKVYLPGDSHPELVKDHGLIWHRCLNERPGSRSRADVSRFYRPGQQP